MKYNTPWAYVRNDDCSINNSPIFFMPIKIIFDVHCLSGALIYNAIWHILKIILCHGWHSSRIISYALGTYVHCMDTSEKCCTCSYCVCKLVKDVFAFLEISANLCFKLANKSFIFSLLIQYFAFMKDTHKTACIFEEKKSFIFWLKLSWILEKHVKMQVCANVFL